VAFFARLTERKRALENRRPRLAVRSAAAWTSREFHWKCCTAARLSWVQIPACPPVFDW